MTPSILPKNLPRSGSAVPRPVCLIATRGSVARRRSITFKHRAPGEATLYLPGLAFINSINSFIVLAGNLELTSQEFGDAPTLVTGMKSFSMSNRIDLYRLGFTTMLDDESKIV